MYVIFLHKISLQFAHLPLCNSFSFLQSQFIMQDMHRQGICRVLVSSEKVFTHFVVVLLLSARYKDGFE
jgi:hypothetical protein